MRILEVCRDPAGQLITFVMPLIAAVRKHHQSVVRLGANDTAGALGRLSHSIKGQEVGLLDLERLPQELQPRTQYPGQCVLIGYAEHDDCTPIVAVEVDTLRDLAAGDGEEGGSAAAVAGAPEGIQRHAGLLHVRGLDEQQLVRHQLIKDAHVVPLGHDLIHVPVRHEEAHHPVRHHRCKLHQHLAVAPDHVRVRAQIELGGHRILIRPPR
mmetsp:Transcript_20938/g.63025  ORF Transcript_20938/g.63025 Transcript_20938/m.63025 type:complete len:211 (-) Transcript_20938:1809-2441(-)